MTTVWVVSGLLLIVTAVAVAARQSSLGAVFRWLPLPLWCYALPMIAVSLGALPREPALYRGLTHAILPLALGLLLLGTDVPAVLRTGGRALVAAVAGAVGIVVGTVMGVAALRAVLPPEAWRGAGCLAGTWTGGTMNLLALRALLEPPEPVFAPLIVVDAVVAYGWMACLVAAAGGQARADRWLCAEPFAQTAADADTAPGRRGTTALGALLVLGAVWVLARLAARLPTSALVASPSAWLVLLVTTAALAASLHPGARRAGTSTVRLGYPLLYLVLAVTGAQADFGALASAPAWLGVGVIVIAMHALTLLLAARLWRIPLGVLATASQANVGGVVSAPLVGAVYHRALAPIGLLLAVAGNALGTYVGLGTAALARLLTG
jgi:uncharacterized membrane protein